MQDALAEDRQQRQDALEGGAAAAGEDRDVAGGGAVAAARHRAVERVAPRASTSAPRRRTSAWSVVLISSQILPGLSAASTPSAASITAALAAGEGRQVITTSLAAASSRAERAAVAPASTSGLHPLRVEVAHRQLHAVAAQIAGKLAADVAETDEADAQVDHARNIPRGLGEQDLSVAALSAR